MKLKIREGELSSRARGSETCQLLENAIRKLPPKSDDLLGEKVERFLGCGRQPAL